GTIVATIPDSGVYTTAEGLEEKSKLQRHFRRIDMLLFTVCALVGLDTLGQVSGFGASTFSWLVLLAIFFLFPYALIMAELGTTFAQEGGPYEWMKLAWGRAWGGVGSVLYWITNPLWVGGSLAFLSTDAWSSNIHPIGSGTFGDYAFKFVFIWISIIVAIVSLRRGKWIPNLGALVRIGVLAFFSITVLIYAIEHGVHGYAVGNFNPFQLTAFLGLVPLLLFNYVGFELQNGAAEEMLDPQKDVPGTVIQGAAISTLAYCIPVFGILAVLPANKITGISGFLDAVHTTFGVYGGAGNFLVDVMVFGFIFALVTSGSVWMMGSDRVQAVAAYDGAFFPWFGRFNAKLGTPVRVNVLSGIVSTAFMVAAVNLSSGNSGNTFKVVLYLATSTTLLSYLLIFTAALRLRYSHPDAERPYRVPGGMAGMWVVVSLTTAWMALGSWVAVFPGTIEQLFGKDFSIQDADGVSRLRFEVFTLGTLGIIVLIGVAGYIAGAKVRAETVEVGTRAATDSSVS
ncbi:MAG: glutamate:GABA antiporter, partial [Gaiellaceae bacterium]|nr:glutamate:GABA antiporter [Gaiellaceae bacterium]